MLSSLSRVLFNSQHSCGRVTIRFVNNSAPVVGGNHAFHQLEYINTAVANAKNLEWSDLKNNTLKIPGSLNQKNIDAVLLKTLVNSRKYDAALSFADFLKSTSKELTLGSINGLLVLYYEMGKEKELSPEQKAFILEVYKDLYNKYNVLDSTTCERLLHALCVIKEWKKALKVLDDIHFSSKPSHSAYSTLIATLFDLNKKGKAIELIKLSVSNQRPIQTKAYDSWINYILRNYKENKTKFKYLEDICLHVLNNSAPFNEDTAKKFVEVFMDLGWDAKFTRIRKLDGKCVSCSHTLECLKLNENEFLSLQAIIKEKLIVGSDLFLKTLPKELDKFLHFVKETAPYDIVLDALNIAYVARHGMINRVDLLKTVVTYFANRKMKILLLGRKHMLHWPKRQMTEIMSKTCSFFIDDLSQDDPYFITAAILSGSHTDFVSKDLLRGHRFKLQDEPLQLLFRKWQWQHQWMVFINRNSKIVIQSPLKFTPCAQKINGIWHLPFECQNEDNHTSQVNDGTPDLKSWICLRPPTVPDKHT